MFFLPLSNVCLSLSFLSVYPSISLFIYVSIHPSIRPSTCLLPACLPVCVPCHPPLKEAYVYFTLDTTPQQLANYLLVLAKKYLASNSTHRQTPDYQRMFHMTLQYRLYTEMHYSLWASYVSSQKLSALSQ
jgi:hypothetical protein